MTMPTSALWWSKTQEGGRPLFKPTTSLELVTRPRGEDTKASGGRAAKEELEEDRVGSCRRRWNELGGY